MSLLNVKAVGNKTYILNDFMAKNKLDFLFLAETWLKLRAPSGSDYVSKSCYHCTCVSPPPKDAVSKEFLKLMDSYDLIQWVNGPTHRLGHMLDLVLSHNLPIQDLNVEEVPFSDHKSVFFNLCVAKTLMRPQTKKWTRKVTPVTSGEFAELYDRRYAATSSETVLCSLTIDEHLSQFKSICSEIFDVVAPLTVKHTRHTSLPWVNDDIRTLRRLSRKAERRWRKSKSQVHYDMFSASLVKFQKASKDAKHKFYSETILENANNPKVFF
ncbi:uncharacterized protein LOC112844225 [Tachysurus ichikawai]